jgi:hypothetical protein
MTQDEVGMSKAALIITIVVVLILIGGAGFFLKTRIDKLTAEPVPTPVAETAPIESVDPTPEPTPAFDRSQYTLRILNGTKTAGLAASVSGKLKELGYEIDRTGNATSSAIAQTTVRVKEDADEGLLEQIISDLSADYKAVAGAVLKDADGADAEIVIGEE